MKCYDMEVLDAEMSFFFSAKRRLQVISTAECNKVVSDIFGKFELLMKYQNMGSYAHFTPYLKVIILLFSKILRKTV